MTPDAPVRRRRCAVVSLGARAQLYTEAPTSSHADRVDLAGFCNVNTHRMAVHDEWTAVAHPHPCVRPRTSV
ncbi:hypothetical protein [Streptomyces sp. S1A1-7]|uniref:hypothetical protein n=1 Tax=Streptomyces sp. S1A1-7 TaxID=2594459 RepID=UPI001F075464|nr:hypothetical protein [Streptomyces sp. S1A1-7]